MTTPTTSRSVLENARHEAFAQALAEGRSVIEAYVQAGYKGVRSEASRLSKNPEVRARVVELTEHIAEKVEWRVADRLAALKLIYEQAVETDPRAAISAIAEANKMQGSYAPAKHHHAGTVKTQSIHVDADKIRGMTDDELDALESAIGKVLEAFA